MAQTGCAWGLLICIASVLVTLYRVHVVHVRVTAIAERLAALDQDLRG